MARANGNDLIRWVQETISEEIEEDERHEKIKTECRARKKNLMSELVKLGQAFEVDPDEVLYKPGLVERRFDIFEDFMFVLRQMKLPEEAIEALSQKAKGEDLIKHLVKDGWLQIEETNIWVKNLEVNVQDWLNNPGYSNCQFTLNADGVLATDLSDNKIYLFNGLTGERLTKGFSHGELLSDGNIRMIDEQDNWFVFNSDGKLLS